MDTLPRNIHTKDDLYNFLVNLSYNPSFSEVIHSNLTKTRKPPKEHEIEEYMMRILKSRYHDFTQEKLKNIFPAFKASKFNKDIIFIDPIDWTKITNDYRKKSLHAWQIKKIEFLRQIHHGYIESKHKKQSSLPPPPPLPDDEVPKFVAEGAYGCVHRPSLFCNPPYHPDYTGKVSKVMTTKNMNKELKEYVLIERADPRNDFYLGKPETCPLGISPINQPPIEKCRMGKNIVQNPQDYSLILMKDGGTNWDEFADQMSGLPVNHKNTERMEHFWLEARRMIYGVKAFINKGIMHHDLKAQNIVYNEPTTRSNFIDFGLMEDMKQTEVACNQNRYGFAVLHWSYPFETTLLNKQQFNKFAKAPRNVRNTFILDFLKGYNDPKNKHGDFIRVFFREAGIQDQGYRNELLKMYQTFIMDKLPNLRHKELLDMYFSKMDVYGLGLSMMYVLTRTQKFLPEFTKKVLPLFLSTLYPDPLIRCSIDNLIQGYDRILVDTGLAKKYKIPGLHQQSPEVLIEKIVKEPTWKEEKVASIIVGDRRSQQLTRSIKDESFAELDPKPVSVKKSTTKFSNMAISTPSPITRRRQRSSSSKSKSAKRARKMQSTAMDVVDSRTIYPEDVSLAMDKIYAESPTKMDVVEEYKKSYPVPMDVVSSYKKTVSNKTIKVCPNGTELNRATGRCQTRKICSPGMKRNPVTNRCQKKSKAWSV
jgi:serine/threonine protein kinase/predicted CopG family antitoxin